MKPYALTPYPMTPPDDPPEPVLDGALPCPECGYEPDWEARLNSTEYRLLCTNHISGYWMPNIEAAIRDWNVEAEEYGQRLKAAGQEKVAEHNEEWLACVLGVIEHWAKSGLEFTVENVRAHWRTLDKATEPKSPNAWGAAFSVAAKQGLIVRVGFQKNSLPSAHSRIVATWRGKQ